MILWKLTRHLRTLESKLSSPLLQENTMHSMDSMDSMHAMDSNETRDDITLQIFAFINDNWTNPRIFRPLSRFYLLQKKIKAIVPVIRLRVLRNWWIFFIHMIL